jgi:hypothetical protein
MDAKKPSRRRVAAVFALLLLLMVPPVAVYGAASVIIATDTTLEVGETFTVTVKYSAESLGRISGELRYDPDMLKYISGGSSSQSAGIVQLSTGLSGEKTYTYTIKFTAIGAGKDFFLVNTFELVNGDEEDLGNPGASVPLTVTASPEDPATEDPGTDQPSDQDPDPSPTDTPDSENPGTDTPAASKETPATRWVYAGVVGLTSLLLLAAVLFVRHGSKKK